MSLRSSKALATCLLGLLPAIAMPLAAEEGSALVGIWVGALKVQSQSLTMVFNVASEKGKLKATIDSPDQGAKGIPVSTVTLTGNSVKIESTLIKGVLTGTLSANGKKIEGTWEQGGAKFPLVLERRNSAPVQYRPQEPKPPFPYRTEEVVIKNSKADIKLAGTFVIPQGTAPFPAVVFATGSGAQDRNEELLGHKPFLVIADYLARRGIASLRCDDRGVGGSGGNFATATTFDFADDVEAEFEYLASRPEIKAGSVGIIGHSEGGLIAPIVAARNSNVGFVVLLAGPGIRGDQLIMLQGAAIAKAMGSSAKDIADGAKINATLYAIAAGPGDQESVMAELKKAYLEALAANKKLTPEQRTQAEAGTEQMLAQLASPWFRSFLNLDPAPYLSKVRVPVLALNGSLDLQVPVKEDLSAIKKAQAGVASPKSKFIELKGLNHLFQRAKKGLPDEYGKIEETVAPDALKTIGDWILGL